MVRVNFWDLTGSGVSNTPWPCSIFFLQILLGFLLFFLLQGKQSQLQLLPRLCLLESKIDILEYFAPIWNKYNSVHSSGILIKAAADRFPMNCITWAGQFIHVFYIFCTWGTTTEQVKTVQLRGTLKPPSILARACGVPAVGVRVVDCWQWRSGHYFHPSFPFSFFFPFFPLSRPFLIEGVLGSKNLFSESWRERPKT